MEGVAGRDLPELDRHFPGEQPLIVSFSLIDAPSQKQYHEEPKYVDRRRTEEELRALLAGSLLASLAAGG